MKTLMIFINTQAVQNATISYTDLIEFGKYNQYQVNVRTGKKQTFGESLPDFSKLERRVKSTMENGYELYNDNIHYTWNELDGIITLIAREQNSNIQLNVEMHDDLQFQQVIDKIDEVLEQADKNQSNFEYEDKENFAFKFSLYGGNISDIKDWLDEHGYFSSFLKKLI